MVDRIPECTICQRLVSVPYFILTGDVIVDVCKDCLKYGERIKVTDIDKMTVHCKLIEVVFL